jgi:dihydroorotate dehydrogenase
MLYRSLLRPLLFSLPPETAHELVLHSLSFAPSVTKKVLGNKYKRAPLGELWRFGLKFANPVGLAAGFDKDGVALETLAALGFGFIEAGTVTYDAQPGNPRPRLFRLKKDKALINRAGFNNQGAEAFVERVSRHRPDYLLGVSIGKSRTAPVSDAVADYVKSFEVVHPVADYIAVNVSSPNTPGLRELQEPDQLQQLLKALQMRNAQLGLKPLLIKLSPDLTDKQLEAIVNVGRANNVAGIIATNTTIERDNLQTPAAEIEACGAGGLSGVPLRQRSTAMIATLYRLTGGTLPLIGVGGVFTPEDAWEKITAGASLVQLYTGFIYQGPTIARDINEGLAKILHREGFRSLDEAVGCHVKGRCS